MKIINIFLALLLILSFSINAQNSLLYGTVKDAKTGTELSGVNIIVDNNRFGTSSDSKGNYFFENIPAGNYEIVFSHIGYKNVKYLISLSPGIKEIFDVQLEPTPINLGEALVTSTLYDKLIKETPIPIETISKKELDKKNYTGIADALQNEPGLSIRKDGIWGSETTIRGMSQNNVVTIIDGSRIETSTNLAAGMSLIDINDIERIEVIKSGASSIYGSGAMGGAVNIITKSNSYSDKFIFSGTLASGFNSVNDGKLGTLSLFANSKNWKIKLTGSYRDAKNVKTPGGILPNSNFKDNNLSALLGFKPFNNHELNVNFQLFRASDVGISGGSTFPQNASAKYLTANRELYSVDYKIENISKSILSLSVKGFHQKIFREVEVIPNPNARLNPGANHFIYGGQFKMRLLINDLNYLVTGFDYWEREYNGYRYRYVIPMNRIIYEKPLPDAKFKSYGFFLHNDVVLIPEKLNLLIGGRYDFINVSNDAVDNPIYIETNGERNNNPPKNPLASFTNANVDNQSWSVNIGTLYSLIPELNFTLNLSRSFRAPNLEERFQFIELFGFTYLGNPDLEPEEGYFFDFGTQLRKNNISARANIFFNSLSNLVTDEFDYTDSLFRKVNVGNANLYGLEFAFEVDFINNFVLYGNASYVMGKDLDLNTNLPQIPPFNAIIGLRTPLLYFMNIDFTAYMVSDQNKVAPGESLTPGYAKFDLIFNSKQFSIGLLNASINIGIENVFDKSYRNHLSTYRGIIVEEPGRNFYARLNITW